MSRWKRAYHDLNLDWLTSNLGLKVVSISISIVLWVIVLGSRNIEVTKDVQVELLTSSELIASNEIPEKVTFRLAGPKAFLRAVLDRREDPIRINLSNSRPGLITYRLFADNIQLPIGVKVLSVSPSVIPIKLEAVRRKEVPVRLETMNDPPEGFKVARVQIVPETVKIKGAESRIASINEMVSAPVDLAQLRDEQDIPLDLQEESHRVRLEGPVPVARFEIEPMSANYKLKAIEVKVLTSKRFRVTPAAVTVYARVAFDQTDVIRQMDRRKVFGLVDLSTRPAGLYPKQHVKVRLPEGATVVKIVPELVDVVLSD